MIEAIRKDDGNHLAAVIAAIFRDAPQYQATHGETHPILRSVLAANHCSAVI